MTGREQHEYGELRTTIRQRGTARVWIFVAGIGAWAAATIATAALASTPIATLLPLLVLASVFEAVFALHVGVERIGRYIQVFHETHGSSDSSDPGGAVGSDMAGGPSGPGWEHVTMAFGRPAGAPTVDALFSVPFLLAALFNAAPAMILNPLRSELIFVGGAHALFVLRLVVARLAAAKQRKIDLERFQQLKRA
jgi:hypothetical protein